MTSKERPVPRPGSRVILINPRDEVLLFQGMEATPEAKPFWFMPGGGLSAGETYEEGALRELWEETGLAGVQLGPCVWVRTHVWFVAAGPAEFEGKWVESRERFYVVRGPEFALSSEHRELYEVGLLDAPRWWDVESMAASADSFSPGELAALLQDILAGRYPTEPVRVGV